MKTQGLARYTARARPTAPRTLLRKDTERGLACSAASCSVVRIVERSGRVARSHLVDSVPASEGLLPVAASAPTAIASAP